MNTTARRLKSKRLRRENSRVLIEAANESELNHNIDFGEKFQIGNSVYDDIHYITFMALNQ